MEKISLNKFRNLTKHRKIKYAFTGNNGTIKKFDTEKFYCNPFGSGKNRMLSMPKFCLSVSSEFFQISETQFRAVSEYGVTEFTVEV